MAEGRAEGAAETGGSVISGAGGTAAVRALEASVSSGTAASGSHMRYASTGGSAW